MLWHPVVSPVRPRSSPLHWTTWMPVQGWIAESCSKVMGIHYILELVHGFGVDPVCVGRKECKHYDMYDHEAGGGKKIRKGRVDGSSWELCTP